MGFYSQYFGNHGAELCGKYRHVLPIIIDSQRLDHMELNRGAKKSINQAEAVWLRILAALLLMSTMSFVLAEILN
ncbi:hypothetical protein [Marinococcus luteus]|uniref:hypothetical protein n=1 Tax=Marinococcus luteus TaxID=1122204 RepID=UPI002ACD71A5|nr:hypothetical protein [Marinococcus luteus]